MVSSQKSREFSLCDLEDPTFFTSQWALFEMDLCQAILNHDVEQARNLLSRPDRSGQTVNYSSPSLSRRTPLHLACEQNNEELVRMLLGQPSIDVNQRNKAGATPFLCACVFASSSSLLRRFLADPRTDLSLPDHDGFTPAFWLSFSGKLQYLKLLIASGRPFDYETKAVLKTLARGHAAVEMKEEEYTPEEAATREGKATVARLLRMYKQHPQATTQEVRLELEDRDAYVADLFVEVVLVTDGFLRPNDASRDVGGSHSAVAVTGRELVTREEVEGRRRARTFFRIMSKLPIELQMVLCHLGRDSVGLTVKGVDVEKALRHLVLLMERGQFSEDWM